MRTVLVFELYQIYFAINYFYSCSSEDWLACANGFSKIYMWVFHIIFYKIFILTIFTGFQISQVHNFCQILQQRIHRFFHRNFHRFFHKFLIFVKLCCKEFSFFSQDFKFHRLFHRFTIFVKLCSKQVTGFFTITPCTGSPSSCGIFLSIF